MTLSEHLRELRNRLFKAAIGVVAGGIVGFIFHREIIRYFFNLLKDAAEATGAKAELTYPNITDSLVIPIQVAMLVGLVLGAPVWIYQVWQFVTPGLYRSERKWALVVMGTAVPLFLGGVGAALWVLPIATEFLFNFQPDFVANYVQFDNFFRFTVRMILVFGLAFLLPIFVVLLNAAGILAGETLANARRWIILGITVFAAVATPTGDPFSMMMLAGPMWLLFEIAVVICKVRDKRRAAELGYDLGDDEATPDDVLDKLGRLDDDDDNNDDDKK